MCRSTSVGCGSYNDTTTNSNRKTSSRNIRTKYLQRLGFECSTMAPSRAVCSSYTPYTYGSSCSINNGCNHKNRQRRNSDKNGRRDFQDKKPLHLQQVPDSPTCVSQTPGLKKLQSLKPKENQASKKKQRSVSFEETVTVLTIPNKDSYSDKTRKHLWTEPHEMSQNSTRNAVEFASENWDWRQVADDVEFYICPVTGEKVHPCHATYSYQQTTSICRPLHRHPFLKKSRQAAIAWQQCSRNM